MNNFELKKKLYEVYKNYKDQKFMSDVFVKTIDGFYGQPDPDIFIKKIEGYIKSFDEGKGSSDYESIIEEWRSILNISDEEKLEVDVETTNDDLKEDVSNFIQPEPQVIVNVDEIESKPIQVEIMRPSDEDVSSSNHKVTPIRPKEIEPKIVKKGKLNQIDLTIKTIKIPMSNGLIDLLDDNVNKVSRDFILGAGVLTDDEIMILTSNPSNTTVLKNHDFILTRSDLFTMLSLLGLSHLNIDISDGLLDDIFNGNDLKIEFFNFLMNANSIELDIQSKVSKLQTLFDKNKSQIERIEIMLAHLLLDRANVPKDKNRDTIKQYLDTSSVMNQNIEAFSVLNGVISSKIISLKDYKRSRGE